MIKVNEARAMVAAHNEEIVNKIKEEAQTLLDTVVSKAIENAANAGETHCDVAVNPSSCAVFNKMWADLLFIGFKAEKDAGKYILSIRW